MKRMLILLSVLLCLFSCNSYTITKVTDENRHEIKGLRFFQPAPFLLVAEKDLLLDGIKTINENSEGKTTTVKKMAVARRELQCSVIYLPDPQKEYSISIPSGKSPATVRLEDGCRLTGINLSDSPLLKARDLSLLSGSKDLQPGVYAILYQDGQPILKKVEVRP